MKQKFFLASLVTVFFLSFLQIAYSTNWRVSCESGYCSAKAYHIVVRWKKAQNSTFNGTLESINGIPIDNQEFNLVIEKLNSQLNLSIPKGNYLNDFIEWLGEIGYAQSSNNIDRDLAAAQHTLDIYANNNTDGYICAFLAYKFPNEINKIDFQLQDNSKLADKLMFIKYLGLLEKGNIKNASKLYIALLQNKNLYNQYIGNFNDWIISNKANEYYTYLSSSLKHYLILQAQYKSYQKMQRILPYVLLILAFIWIMIFGYYFYGKRIKNK